MESKILKMSRKEFAMQCALGTIDMETLYRLSSSSNTPARILDMITDNLTTLSRLKGGFLLNTIGCSIAENPNSTPKILRKLSNTSSVYNYIEYSLATHPNTPSDLLKRLSESRDSDVRKMVAMHLNASHHTLYVLSYDKDDYVRAEVARNPCTGVSILKTLIEHDPIYSNRDAAQYQLEILKRAEEKRKN